MEQIEENRPNAAQNMNKIEEYDKDACFLEN